MKQRNCNIPNREFENPRRQARSKPAFKAGVSAVPWNSQAPVTTTQTWRNEIRLRNLLIGGKYRRGPFEKQTSKGEWKPVHRSRQTQETFLHQPLHWGRKETPLRIHKLKPDLNEVGDLNSCCVVQSSSWLFTKRTSSWWHRLGDRNKCKTFGEKDQVKDSENPSQEYFHNKQAVGDWKS